MSGIVPISKAFYSILKKVYMRIPKIKNAEIAESYGCSTRAD